MCRKPNRRFSITVENLLYRKPGESAPPDTVQLHNCRIDPAKKAFDKFYRWQPLVIKNNTTKGWTIRHARGGIPVKGLTPNSIVLDYDAQWEMGFAQNQNNEIVVRPATWMEVYLYYYNHHHALVRMNTRLAVLGLILGTIIGVLGSLIGFLV